jgi:hypothetical protein
MTLGAWLAAFCVVTAILAIFGHQLATLALPFRALVFGGALVAVMVNLVMPALGRVIDGWVRGGPTPPSEHPRLETLPDWPGRTIAVLSTLDDGPYAIPVSAPQRADDHRILLGLRRDRGSLARLRRQPRVALLVLAEGDVAFTARGQATIVQEPMVAAPDYAAIAIDVEQIDDHRQAAFVVESGVDRHWLDADEQRELRERVVALRALASAELVAA